MLPLLLLMNFFQISFGMHESGISLSINYFNYRDVKFICYLTCGRDSTMSRIFAKETTKHSIGISIAINNNEDNIKDCLKTQTLPIGVVIDCLDSDDVLTYASENMLFDATHKWLLLQEGNNSSFEDNTIVTNDHLIKTWNMLNLSIDADITIALGYDNLKYVMYEVYYIGKVRESELTIEKIGSWTKETGLHLTINLNDYKYYRRWDFKEFQMRMITVVSPAPSNFTVDMLIDIRPTPGVAHITKTALMCLSVIAEIHNIRFVHTVTDRWIGTFEKNSSRVVANSIYFKEQDITPILRPMLSLFDKMDFLHTPLTSIETRYYYRIPTYGAGKFENQFLRPLTFGAWGCALAVITLCAIVLLLSAISEERPTTLQYAIFSVIASFCQQFFQDTDDNESRRVSAARKLAILVTGLSCVLIYNYYTSSVVSWLLNGPPPSINSLEELIESPLELIFEDIGYTRSWLQTPSYYYNKRNAIAEDELRLKKVFNKKADAPLFKIVEEGIAMVKNGGYAYHTEVNSANQLISSTFTQMELCELGSLQSMEKTRLYPCVQKNSPYKEFFVWSLLRLSERGIISCIQRRTSSPEVVCEGSSPRALALGGAAPAFILLLGGYVLAFIIMIAERIIYEYLNRNV